VSGDKSNITVKLLAQPVNGSLIHLSNLQLQARNRSILTFVDGKGIEYALRRFASF